MLVVIYKISFREFYYLLSHQRPPQTWPRKSKTKRVTRLFHFILFINKARPTHVCLLSIFVFFPLALLSLLIINYYY